MGKKRLKTVRAGRLVYGVCYSQALASDSPKARAAKSKCSSAARQALNFRAAWQKLRLLLCANFARGDLWVTLTYDDDHLPDGRREAKKRITLFLDRLRAARCADPRPGPQEQRVRLVRFHRLPAAGAAAHRDAAPTAKNRRRLLDFCLGAVYIFRREGGENR
jgi:hypothetical protein